MRKTIFRTIKISLGVLVFVAILGNSGCLVDTGSDLTEPKAISQKHLRIYKAGDRIRYDVQYDIYKGTLETKWELPVLDEIVDANPVDPGPSVIPGLLKETTTLELEASIEPITVIRYITQETSDSSSPDYGSITVHAYDSPVGPVPHHYVHEDSTSLLPPGPPTPAVIVPSPLPLDDNFDPIAGQPDWAIDYYVLPCDSDASTCDISNQNLSDTLFLSEMEKETLDTTLDSFQSIKIRYEGNVYTTGPSAVRLNIRAFCGVVDDDQFYSGYEWYYPSIGVVRFQVQCNSSSGDTKFFSANVSSVNFSY